MFDTSPLCHFAQQNWLGLLKAVVGERTAVVPDVVSDELRAGAGRDSRLDAVLAATWIEHRELRTVEEVTAFARFAELLVAKDRNRGEAAVLALAATTGGVAVIDDSAARQAARRNASHSARRSPCSATRSAPICSPSGSSPPSRTTCWQAPTGCPSRPAASRSGQLSTASRDPTARAADHPGPRENLIL